MQTIVIRSEDINSYATGLAEAAAALRAGELVIFPTETVYGVGANAANRQAVAHLREVKGRHDQQPFSAHLGRRQDARLYLSNPSPLVRRLVRKGWPGPLTLVCEEPAPQATPIAQECPPEQLAAIYHKGTVGLRCPDHTVAARLLTEAGVPVIASSANRGGLPPPQNVHEALRDLGGAVKYALDAGQTRHNAASTIVEVRGNAWRILRPGAIDERTLRRLARSEILFVCTGNSCRSPMAEYLFRQRLGQALNLSPEMLAAAGYGVSSAGTLGYDGGPASSGATEEMRRRGIDVRGHRSQALTVPLIHHAERIYALSPEHLQAVLDLVPSAAGRATLLDADRSVQDPMGGSADDYARCATQIDAAVAARVQEFLDEDRDW